MKTCNELREKEIIRIQKEILERIEEYRDWTQEVFLDDIFPEAFTMSFWKELRDEMGFLTIFNRTKKINRLTNKYCKEIDTIVKTAEQYNIDSGNDLKMAPMVTKPLKWWVNLVLLIDNLVE